MGRLSLSQWSNGQTSCGHGRLERSVTSQRLILLAATLRALLVLSLACPGSSVPVAGAVVPSPTTTSVVPMQMPRAQPTGRALQASVEPKPPPECKRLPDGRNVCYGYCSSGNKEGLGPCGDLAWGPAHCHSEPAVPCRQVTCVAAGVACPDAIDPPSLDITNTLDTGTDFEPRSGEGGGPRMHEAHGARSNYGEETTTRVNAWAPLCIAVGVAGYVVVTKRLKKDTHVEPPSEELRPML